MRFVSWASAATLAVSAWAPPASALDIDGAHKAFVDAFNNRDWDAVRAILADDIVFHRGNADIVHVGADAVIDRFLTTIGNNEQWNVKFAVLDSTDSHTGVGGSVVERGAFGVTAGPDDGACYAGSYMMTWTPEGKLSLLSWQDVESEMAACGK